MNPTTENSSHLTPKIQSSRLATDEFLDGQGLTNTVVDNLYVETSDFAGSPSMTNSSQVPSHSTSEAAPVETEQPSIQQPSHPMRTRLKDNIVKPKEFRDGTV